MQRLEELRRKLPYMSMYGLGAVLKEVKYNLPQAASRQTIARARDALINQTTNYGLVLTTLTLNTIAGDPMEFDAVNPFALLCLMYAQCSAFTALLDDCAARFPPNVRPWRIALYSDEITPGDALSHDNRRKTWVVYFSFLEFGAAVLSQEDAWLVLGVFRSSRLRLCEGSICQAFKRIIKLCFKDSATAFQTTGVRLTATGRAGFRLFARLAIRTVEARVDGEGRVWVSAVSFLQESCCCQERDH